MHAFLALLRLSYHIASREEDSKILTNMKAAEHLQPQDMLCLIRHPENNSVEGEKWG